jgi:rhodanese-related sulfurtransferase
MQITLWALSIGGLAVALVALRQCLKLGRDIGRLKRDHYYAESRVKRVPEEIREAVQPLRLQLAGLAAGKPVSPDLILSGRPYRNVSGEEAQCLIEENGGLQSARVVVLDVRTPKEYAIRHVAGAQLVPFEEIEQRHQTDIPDAADKIFVYCMSGERSRLTCDFLSSRGYTNVYNIKDGLQGWPGPTEGEGEIKFIRLQSKQ